MKSLTTEAKYRAKKRLRTTTAEFASPARSVNGGIDRYSLDISKGSPKRLRNDIRSHGGSEPDICHLDGTCVDRARVSSHIYGVRVLNEAPEVLTEPEWADVAEVIYSVDMSFSLWPKEARTRRTSEFQ
jgi:hypothetical protein